MRSKLKRALFLTCTAPFILLGFVVGVLALCCRIIWAALVEGFLLAYGGEE